MNITLQDFFNGVIYAGALAGAISGIGILLHFTVVRPVRKFLKTEVTVHLVEIKSAIDDNGHELTQLREDYERLATEFHDHVSDGHGTHNENGSGAGKPVPRRERNA